ncbi:hypothetical protein ACFRAR_11065 [Kitasatospora sp. NPDC056651]|uniref:hypothetical protein n=1 Tax=Kitasatospora sp. NPDC056651 TaxID=3345892 RepID=UPI00369A3773
MTIPRAPPPWTLPRHHLGRSSNHDRPGPGPRPSATGRPYHLQAGKKEKTFDYPEDLQKAQRALEDGQARRRAFLSGLPAWGSNLEAAAQGLSDEQAEQSKQLEEEERQASHAVWANDYWATLPPEDHSDARSKLKHLQDPDPA